MPSVCHNIKTEYEALKTLKEKFVSACNEAGGSARLTTSSFDALSKQELNKLKLLKRELEHKRDALEKKIENKPVRILKKTLNSIEGAIIGGDSPYEGQRVSEFLAGEDFQQLLADAFRFCVQSGQVSPYFAFQSASRFYSAFDSGLLNEKNIDEIGELLDGGLLKRNLVDRIEQYIQKAIVNSNNAISAVRGFYAALRLGFLNEADIERMRGQMEGDEFRVFVEINISASARRGNVLSGNTLDTIAGFRAAWALGLISLENIQRIQALIEAKEFQDNVIKSFVNDVERSHSDGEAAMRVPEYIVVIKGLIELSRRKKK